MVSKYYLLYIKTLSDFRLEQLRFDERILSLLALNPFDAQKISGSGMSSSALHGILFLHCTNVSCIFYENALVPGQAQTPTSKTFLLGTLTSAGERDGEVQHLKRRFQRATALICISESILASNSIGIPKLLCRSLEVIIVRTVVHSGLLHQKLSWSFSPGACTHFKYSTRGRLHAIRNLRMQCQDLDSFCRASYFLAYLGQVPVLLIFVRSLHWEDLVVSL